jgi:pimeloyl-ACP methyl ester carboxylesterase
MALVKVGDIELSYEREGTGPPLLLIMGMSGTLHHWGPELLERLQRDFQAIVYDHRGVGQSSPTSEPFTIAQLGEDAAGLLNALEIESAHVMGISMGGMVAQELVLAHPELVRTLVLGCTYCGGEGSALASQQVMSRLVEAMMSGDRARAIRAGWEANLSPRYAADDEAYERFLQVATHYVVPVQQIMLQMQAISGHDTSKRLGGLQTPTLVIHGTVDQMLPVQNGHMIAGLIPDSRLEIFDDVGHLFFWEEPQRSAELVREHAAVNV